MKYQVLIALFGLGVNQAVHVSSLQQTLDNQDTQVVEEAD